ncbi:MAG: histidinol phosphate phosphatase domain-containing protein [Actinobacteria bacterium]|nr:histidinol phosphate phosphatase domain-containing protein [Actinomycetota bacterium]
MLFDFQTHTFLSDGALSPMELLRRCRAAGYTAVAITDHASPANVESLVPAILRDCRVASEEWGLTAIAGVEITHVPPSAIDRVARQALDAGAEFIAVHGETIVEPVEAGTNRAALESAHVHALVHPGLLSPELASVARANGKFVELSARRGHSLSNGHVASLCREAGVRMLVNSDAHEPIDLLSEAFARRVARGAGLNADETETVLVDNPLELLRILGKALPEAASKA